MFEVLPQLSADPILGLSAAFKADSHPNKIDLGVGVYKDEQGHTPILDSVAKAQRILLDKEDSKTYITPQGVQGYIDGMLQMMLGKDSSALLAGRIAAVQAPGGCGALRILSELIKRCDENTTVWVSDPTWANHIPLIGNAGLTIQTYPYFDKANASINFDAMAECLGQVKKGDVVLLHGCCHNPTGIDPTANEWEELAKLCANKGLLPLFDFAYQGFAKGVEEDAAGLRTFAQYCPELLVASSFSKNFGLYNERVGAFTLVAKDAAVAADAFSQVKAIIRSIYSNPPAHGAAVVTHILNDDTLRAEWEQEVAEMRDRIQEMRTLFVTTLKEQGVDADFSFIERQNGMFSFSGLSKEQVNRLKDEFAIYIVGSGRISVAGMTKDNMLPLCKGIAAVL